MAARKDTVSFDDIIQADRQRRKNAALAEEIFGKGRKANSTSTGSRKSGTGPSLASRVGIAKTSQRSASSTSRPKPDIEAIWGHDLHRANNHEAPRVNRLAKENPIARQFKSDLLYDAVTPRTSRPGLPLKATAGGASQEISIRGAAGPYVVIGTNFAPGTTAADIESAMIPSGGEMQSCGILTATPTVIAEMVFSEKHNAENVIETFNNKKADGRILHVYMNKAGPAQNFPLSRKTPVEPRASPIDLPRNHPLPSYDTQREQSDRTRRRADPEFQDGSFGFDAKEDRMDVDADVPVGVPPARVDRRDERRDDRRDNRYDAPKDYGRGRHYNRDLAGGRPRDDRRLYSDDLYPRPRGRGFR